MRLLIFKLPEPVFGPLIYAEKWLQAESVIYDHHTQGQHWFFGRRGVQFRREVGDRSPPVGSRGDGVWGKAPRAEETLQIVLVRKVF